ncbi:hypothetical protein HII36_25940 [Nonomuraea sp. NN258]|uniref:hypothetical protein n=1 Tax=Nonomuraea antri TaxID=2730852 RepID=UPI0015687A54|nr:hypothetical protein [Nonomuraea antri]NRQ35241.1 hypothetical protein [Nonomuraea antri]
MMRQYAGNRIGLAVVGGILLAAGTLAWLRGHDRLFGLAPHAKILPAQLTRPIAEEPWPLWLLALVLLLTALTALRWLLISLGWGRRGTREDTGTAMLFVGLKGVDGLSKAGVRAGEDGVRIAVTCPPAADVGAVVGKLDQDVVGKIRREIRDDEAATVVRLHVRRK